MNRFSLVLATVMSLSLSAIQPALAQSKGDATATLKAKKKKKKKVDLKIGARLYALWTVTDDTDDPANEFSVAMARVKFDWRYAKLIRGVLQADFEQLLDEANEDPLLRDMYVQIRPLRQLRVRVGQFKRPFSRLELRGRSRLELVKRGPSNDWLIEDLKFGDRDIGLMLEGRFGNGKRNIEYAAGIFNGAGKNDKETDLNGAKDYAVRLQGKPADWLSLGVSSSFKTVDVHSIAYYPEFAWAYGADARLKLGSFSLLAEGLFGQNHDRCAAANIPAECREQVDGGDLPHSWSAVLLGAYQFDLGTKARLKLQPLIKLELLQPNTDLDDADVLSIVVGTNLKIARHVRVMVQGELLEAGPGLPEHFKSEKRMLLQVALDI